MAIVDPAVVIADDKPAIVIIPQENQSGQVFKSRHQSAEGIRDTIRHLWFARKAALDVSDSVQAQARVEELRTFMSQEGITADRSTARGFAYEGYENLREGNYERARIAFNLARSFDPFLPQAQYGYAWSLLRAGRGVFTFIDEYMKGIRLSWAHFLTDEIRLSNFAIVLAVAVLASMSALSLAVVARCQGRIRHDLFETARRRMPERAARVASWAIFLLPLLAWAGGIWLILFWLVLSFRYMRLPEKMVAGCVFLMIGLAPLGVATALDRFEAATDPEISVVVAALQEGYNPDNVQELQRVVRSHEESAELHLLLGTVYAKGDLLGEAFDSYQKVLELNPIHISALINVGNVYFRLGESSEAVNRYKQALRVQPDLVSAYWNLYLAQTELLHFSESEASLLQARSLHKARVGRLLAQKKDAGARRLIQEQASLGRIRSDLTSGEVEPAQTAESLVSPLSVISGAGFVFALILGVGRRDGAQACRRCGRTFCARCVGDRSGNGFCKKCVHLFLRTKGITADVRAGELAILSRRDRVSGLIRRLLSTVLPGSGQIMGGRTALGVPLLVGWVLATVFVVSRERLLLPTHVPVSDLPPPSLVIGLVFMVVIWIAGQVASTRRPISIGEANGA